MLTKNGIGNLINKYKAVLKKCHLMNTFGSLAVAGMLVVGGVSVAGAATDLAVGTTGSVFDVDGEFNITGTTTITGNTVLNKGTTPTAVEGALTLGVGADHTLGAFGLTLNSAALATANHVVSGGGFTFTLTDDAASLLNAASSATPIGSTDYVGLVLDNILIADAGAGAIVATDLVLRGGTVVSTTGAVGVAGVDILVNGVGGVAGDYKSLTIDGTGTTHVGNVEVTADAAGNLGDTKLILSNGGAVEGDVKVGANGGTVTLTGVEVGGVTTGGTIAGSVLLDGDRATGGSVAVLNSSANSTITGALDIGDAAGLGDGGQVNVTAGTLEVQGAVELEGTASGDAQLNVTGGTFKAGAGGTDTIGVVTGTVTLGNAQNQAGIITGNIELDGAVTATAGTPPTYDYAAKHDVIGTGNEVTGNVLLGSSDPAFAKGGLLNLTADSELTVGGDITLAGGVVAAGTTLGGAPVTGAEAAANAHIQLATGATLNANGAVTMTLGSINNAGTINAKAGFTTVAGAVAGAGELIVSGNDLTNAVGVTIDQSKVQVIGVDLANSGTINTDNMTFTGADGANGVVGNSAGSTTPTVGDLNIRANGVLNVHGGKGENAVAAVTGPPAVAGRNGVAGGDAGVTNAIVTGATTNLSAGSAINVVAGDAGTAAGDFIGGAGGAAQLTIGAGTVSASLGAVNVTAGDAGNASTSGTTDGLNGANATLIIAETLDVTSITLANGSGEATAPVADTNYTSGQSGAATLTINSAGVGEAVTTDLLDLSAGGAVNVMADDSLVVTDGVATTSATFKDSAEARYNVQGTINLTDTATNTVLGKYDVNGAGGDLRFDTLNIATSDLLDGRHDIDGNVVAAAAFAGANTYADIKAGQIAVRGGGTVHANTLNLATTGNVALDVDGTVSSNVLIVDGGTGSLTVGDGQNMPGTTTGIAAGATATTLLVNGDDTFAAGVRTATGVHDIQANEISIVRNGTLALGGTGGTINAMVETDSNGGAVVVRNGDWTTVDNKTVRIDFADYGLLESQGGKLDTNDDANLSELQVFGTRAAADTFIEGTLSLVTNEYVGGQRNDTDASTTSGALASTALGASVTFNTLTLTDSATDSGDIDLSFASQNIPAVPAAAVAGQGAMGAINADKIQLRSAANAANLTTFTIADGGMTTDVLTVTGIDSSAANAGKLSLVTNRAAATAGARGNGFILNGSTTADAVQGVTTLEVADGSFLTLQGEQRATPIAVVGTRNVGTNLSTAGTGDIYVNGVWTASNVNVAATGSLTVGDGNQDFLDSTFDVTGGVLTVASTATTFATGKDAQLIANAADFTSDLEVAAYNETAKTVAVGALAGATAAPVDKLLNNSGELRLMQASSIAGITDNRTLDYVNALTETLDNTLTAAGSTGYLVLDDIVVTEWSDTTTLSDVSRGVQLNSSTLTIGAGTLARGASVTTTGLRGTLESVVNQSATLSLVGATPADPAFVLAEATVTNNGTLNLATGTIQGNVNTNSTGRTNITNALTTVTGTYNNNIGSTTLTDSTLTTNMFSNNGGTLNALGVNTLAGPVNNKANSLIIVGHGAEVASDSTVPGSLTITDAFVNDGTVSVGDTSGVSGSSGAMGTLNINGTLTGAGVIQAGWKDIVINGVTAVGTGSQGIVNANGDVNAYNGVFLGDPSWKADATLNTIDQSSQIIINNLAEGATYAPQYTLAVGQNSFATFGMDSASAVTMYNQYAASTGGQAWGSGTNNTSAALFVGAPVNLSAANAGEIVVDGLVTSVVPNGVGGFRLNIADGTTKYSVGNAGGGTALAAGSVTFAANSALFLDATNFMNATQYATAAVVDPTTGAVTSPAVMHTNYAFTGNGASFTVSPNSKIVLANAKTGNYVNVATGFAATALWTDLDVNDDGVINKQDVADSSTIPVESVTDAQLATYTADSQIMTTNGFQQITVVNNAGNGDNYQLLVGSVADPVDPARPRLYPNMDLSVENMLLRMYNGGYNDYNSTNAGIMFLTRVVENLSPEARILAGADPLTNANDNGRAMGSAIEGVAQAAQVSAVSASTMAASDASTGSLLARVSNSPAHANTNMAAMSLPLDGSDSGMSAGNGADGMGLGVWLTPLYKHTSAYGFDSGNFESGFNTDLYGITLGADVSFAEAFTVGLAFNVGGGNSSSTGDFSEATNDFDFWGIAGYLGYNQNNFGLLFDVGYTGAWNSVDQDSIAGIGMGGFEADVNSSAWTVGLRAEYVIQTEALDITPHIGVRYTGITVDEHDVNAKGFGTVFNVESSNQDIWTFPIGVTLSKDIETSGGWSITPMIDLGIVATAGDFDATTEASIPGFAQLGSTDLEMQTVDGFAFDGGLGLGMSNGAFSFDVNYNIQLSEHTTSHMVFGTFRYDF